MNTENIKTTTQIGGYIAISGGVTMLIGAVLDTLAASSDVAGEINRLAVANLTLWIIGVLLLGAAGTVMANLCVEQRAMAQIAAFSYATGVSLAITAFVAWLALVVQVAPETDLVTEVIDWFASRADWTATILIIGTGPVLLARAGRGEWVPTWLAHWSILAAITGLLTAVAMLTGGAGLLSYGFLIVPVGIGWMIAAGVVLLRHGGK